MHKFGTCYECDCPYLNRQKLPFRNAFEQLMVDGISSRSTREKKLTYVSHGPGGMLADLRILRRLIDLGFKELTIICVEPLYQKNMCVLQAALDFNEWCKQQNCSITTHWFFSLKEYAAACTIQPHLRGNVYVCIDPDDQRIRPCFELISFRKRFNCWFNETMHPESLFYYLYFETLSGMPLRHIIQGSHTIIDSKPFIHIHYSTGELILETQRDFYFWGNQAVYSFCNKTHAVQVGRRVVVNEPLARLIN